MERIDRYDLDCGMPLFVNPIDSMKSIGLTWLLPVGSASDPADAVGASAVLSEWLWRGAGNLNSREHSEALDRLGVNRDTSDQTYFMRLGATMIGARLHDALPLLVDAVVRPRLEDATFEPVRDLTLQSIEGLQDEPSQQVMLSLRERSIPAPFNRTGYGELSHVQALTPERARSVWADRCRPGGSILAISGAVDGPTVAALLNSLLSGFDGAAEEPVELHPRAGGYQHEAQETAQVHIALAHDAPPDPHADAVLERVAVNVLSGGMSGRLFTEVREKRSLCYSVYATFAAGRDRGRVMGYVGTTPERAQESLEVMMQEIDRIAEGVDEREFHRAVIGMKSRLVMQGESTSSRAAAIATDQFVHGRPRTLLERAQQVDGVTLEMVNAYLRNRPRPRYTIASLGAKALTAPEGRLIS